MKTKGYNQRRACALAGIDPRVYRRKSKRPTDTALRIRMKELASERRRFGYRRLHILLKREDWDVNWKKLYRLYREQGLTVPVSAPCLPHDCGMARRLQSILPSFEPRRAHSVAVWPTVKRGPNPEKS